jgi:hypothetical protein
MRLRQLSRWGEHPISWVEPYRGQPKIGDLALWIGLARAKNQVLLLPCIITANDVDTPESDERVRCVSLIELEPYAGLKMNPELILQDGCWRAWAREWIRHHLDYEIVDQY